MKTCSRCGESKSLEDFPLEKRHRDGRGSRCKTCVAELSRDWRAKNPEKSAAANRRWKQENPERRRQLHDAWVARDPAHARELARGRGRRYDRKNREARLAKSARWLAEHPDWNREKSHRRRALERGSAVEPVDRQAIYDRDNGICHLCDQPVDRADFTLDHVIPIALGGPHTPANVAVAHGTCNFRRGTRSVEEYRAIA